MPRQGLDSGRVVEEAARIADADGLDAVTLARVAQALGVRAPSLYNHVDGRAGLLRLLSLLGIEELTEALRDAAMGRSGAEALAAIAGSYRAYALAHPGRYAATVRAPAPGDERLAAAAQRALDVIVAVLAAWGIAGEEALHRVRVVRSALHGFVSLEAAGGFGLPLDLDRSFELLLATLVAGLEGARQ
ncbi:MAG TPA: WHG domain-containing protein [Solirubrobacteraceae bacterium]|nr:WHG domain-containing protein [Solirubrobacteraceae bacterium]